MLDDCWKLQKEPITFVSGYVFTAEIPCLFFCHSDEVELCNQEFY